MPTVLGAPRRTAVALGVLALLVLVIGFWWRSGVRPEWAWQGQLANAGIIAAAVLVAGSVVLYRWSPKLTYGVAAITIVGLVGSLAIVVDEVRVGAYSGGERRDVASVDQVPTRPTFAAPAPSPIVASGGEVADLAIRAELVMEGFEQSIAVAPVPGSDDLLVAERPGKVWILSPDTTVSDEPIVNLLGETDTDGERGLLDLTFSPDGDRLYLSFTNEDGDNQISSWRFMGDRVDLASRLDVITIQQPYETHNGGAIRFGPDGYLYIGVGDGGRLRDPLDVGQDRGNRLGTILRILPDEQNGDYLIPPDNPFLDAGGWPEIFVYGARNPWRISFDAATGDLWVGDTGQSEFEEVHHVAYDHTGDFNFGWRRMVADEIYLGADFDPTGYDESDRPPDHLPPVFTYPHDPEQPLGARSAITGGVVYRGSAIPDLWGAYMFGDWTRSEIGVVVFDDQLQPVSDAWVPLDVPLPSAFVADNDGEILITSLAGSIWRIVPA